MERQQTVQILYSPAGAAVSQSQQPPNMFTAGHTHCLGSVENFLLKSCRMVLNRSRGAVTVPVIQYDEKGRVWLSNHTLIG